MRVKVWRIPCDEVGQVAVLGVIPDLFARIELRGVRWKPFHADPRCMTLQVIVHRSTSVAVAPIPDEHDLAAHATAEMSQETHHMRPADIRGVDLPVQADSSSVRGEGDRVNDGQSVMSIPSPQNGRLSPGRPRPAHHRLKHEAAFVQKDDATAFPAGVFLYAPSALDASARCPLRRSRERGARASDNSSPDVPEATIHGPDDIARQTSSRLLRPCVSASRAPWGIQRRADRAGATPTVACAARPKVSADVPASDEGKARLGLFSGRSDTSGVPNSPKRLRHAPPTKDSRPLRAIPQLAGAAAPTPAGSLVVSCAIL